MRALCFAAHAANEGRKVAAGPESNAALPSGLNRPTRWIDNVGSMKAGGWRSAEDVRRLRKLCGSPRHVLCAAMRPARCGRCFSDDAEDVEPAINQRGEQHDDDDADQNALPALAAFPRLSQ